MAHQRPRHVQASVLDLAGVPVAIVQYTPTPHDVVSFLEALPAAMRSPGLAAVLQLLSAPSGATHWPVLCLNDLSDDTIDSIGAIINIVNAVRITGVCFSERWPRDPNFNVPFCGFVAKWAAKVTTVDLATTCLPKHRDECCRALARCTRLKRVGITIDEPGFLEAVTSPAHCVSELELAVIRFRYVPAASTMAAAQRWLASGHACSLVLRNLNPPTDAGLVCALVSSPTLASLRMDQSHALFISLATYIEEQTVCGRFILTGLRPLPALKTLVLRSIRNVGLGQHIFALVAQSLVLEHLCFEYMDLRGVVATQPRVSSSTTLRTLAFNCVVLSESSLEATLTWITRSRHLESITWHDVEYFSVHAGCAANALRRCIDAGACRVRFANCGIDTNGATVLAAALLETHARVAFDLDLSGNLMGLRGVQALLTAVATCTNVSVKLPLWCKDFVENNNCLPVVKMRAADVAIYAIRCLLPEPYICQLHNDARVVVSS
ncbi:hypothetical protein SDRG_12308 [Saprolegnia diclina VS20]|uniref:F-box domain-containing protein n=1 Tax=Saprolegnia diclina (strain VS20) TaxID=1156394 RepID=T0RCU2_SAPDV|nr:hypothetical protein SDRG_12308 [Saprolegnia diclina VS20]EQC30028.1 hypothetical protein SDRG_12308 [Saprolegnia diclina VS20]|eukprot:XP_008616595.1 hypothetical protein SDRG_12308 [Saprolegnia diclina VS20]